MDNNNNHNGKEVHRDQTFRNGQKSGGARPVNKIKKNNIAGENKARPDEPKKITLSTNRNQGNQRKSNAKGQVIKLGNKENKIHQEDTPPRENRRVYPKTASTNTINTANTTAAATPVINQVSEKNISKTSVERFTISDKTGQWLLIAAAIFLIAWVVVFFYYHVGGNSHMLLAFAILCAVISLAGKRKKI